MKLWAKLGTDRVLGSGAKSPMKSRGCVVSQSLVSLRVSDSLTESDGKYPDNLGFPFSHACGAHGGPEHRASLYEHVGLLMSSLTSTLLLATQRSTLASTKSCVSGSWSCPG